MTSKVEKEPVLLVVLIETTTLRWLLAKVGLDGDVTPLLRSEAGNLRAQQQLDADEQLAFLRHRLSGALQRGCNRLWSREMKPCQILMLADGTLPHAAGDLTSRLAEHFVQWMTRPAVTFWQYDFHALADDLPAPLAGELPGPYHEAIISGLAQLHEALQHDECWELVAARP